MKTVVRQWLKQRSSVLMLCCAAFLAGLGLARWHIRAEIWQVGLAVMTAVAVWRRPGLRAGFLVTACLLLGVWRGGGYLIQMAPYQHLARQKVTLTARATLDAVYATSGQLSFEISDIQVISPYQVHLPGTISVKGFGELAVYKGDTMMVQGKLYPTRGGKQAVMSYATITRVGSHQSIIDVLRRKFAAGIQTALPEPIASFGLGLLIGQRNTLPEQTSQTLLMVGLTHIVAVSGYNLTILLNAARRVLGERSKRLTTVTGGGLMVVFLLFTGGSASIVRASVVSGLGLAAWYYGRTVKPLLLILLSGALTAYARPVYVWSDIGWWLSFLAFFGVLVVAPSIATMLQRLTRRAALPVLVMVGIETISAEVMTIPLVLYIFGQVSLVGLAANLLVALLIPLAMLLTFVAGVVAVIAPLVVGWVAWPANLLLTYMIDTATILGNIPGVFRSGVYLTATDMLLSYGLIAALLIVMHAKRPTRYRLR